MKIPVLRRALMATAITTSLLSGTMIAAPAQAQFGGIVYDPAAENFDADAVVAVATPEELTPEWLSAALAAGGRPIEVTSVAHTAIGTGQMRRNMARSSATRRVSAMSAVVSLAGWMRRITSGCLT